MPTDQAQGPGLGLALSVQPQTSSSTCGPQFPLSGAVGAGLPGEECDSPRARALVLWADVPGGE